MTEEQIRQAIYDWIRDDAPLTIKMTLTRDTIDSLIRRVKDCQHEQENSQVDVDRK